MINTSLLNNTFVLKTLLSNVDEVTIVVDVCTIDSDTMRPCKYEFRGNRMDIGRVNIKGIQGALEDVEIESYDIYEVNNKKVFRVYTKRQYQLA